MSGHMATEEKHAKVTKPNRSAAPPPPDPIMPKQCAPQNTYALYPLVLRSRMHKRVTELFDRQHETYSRGRFWGPRSGLHFCSSFWTPRGPIMVPFLGGQTWVPIVATFPRHSLIRCCDPISLTGQGPRCVAALATFVIACSCGQEDLAVIAGRNVGGVLGYQEGGRQRVRGSSEEGT